MLDEIVGGLAITWLELGEPPRQALRKSHTGDIVAISIVFQAGKKAYPRIFLGSDILTPLHDAPEKAQGQLLIHNSGHKERAVRMAQKAPANRIEQ